MIRIGVWIFNVFLLNLLWFIFSLLGLIIFGLFPATAALFSVLRNLIMETDDLSTLEVIRLFWSKFKSEFLKSNLVGFILSICGFILYLDIRVLQQLDNNLFHVSLSIVTFVIGFVYLLIFLYIFPVFVHFDLKVLQYPKHAFILAIGRPLKTIVMMIVLAIVIFLYTILPGLIPVFGVSLISLVIMKTASLSFPEKSGTLN
ncbi:hypothetical protein CR203_13570 [Salipaludibacillus neizhouensis]|uniref:DUF624 domain-containing protein n=1 Tax=Salipaludibacillus neizhouensis TaxID=885475 RepID=A0A3A9KGU7_9BACI|nr:DUF624 domain-containing protein [Salipaludibacillus neizhouensis]RKL66855.1 hypothetical protein CR203_13570 [Salipaludibacillus neizhouensis]